MLVGPLNSVTFQLLCRRRHKSWDITDLRSPWRGKAFKAYSIIDIWSRKIVGFRVEDRESDHLAVEMFQIAFRHHGTPQFVHADSGPAMRSGTLADFLEEHNVTKTHNRPYVSNDNPFSKSEFRTMKYRPNYPGTFESLEAARDHLNEYVPWYNTSRKLFRHRVVLAAGSPRRLLAPSLPHSRPRPAGVLPEAPRTLPCTTENTRTSRHSWNQSSSRKNRHKLAQVTPLNLTREIPVNTGISHATNNVTSG